MIIVVKVCRFITCANINQSQQNYYEKDSFGLGHDLSQQYYTKIDKIRVSNNQNLNFLAINQAMDYAIQSFKQQIQQMFQKTFQELNQKNQLNKNILENLIDAANQQSYQISQLDHKLQNLNQQFNNNNDADVNFIKREVKKNQDLVHQNFNLMMHRLQQIQQGICSSRKNMEHNVNSNRQAEIKIDKMINQMQNIIARQNISEYKGDRETLTKEIQDFQAMLRAEIQKERNITDNLEFSKKTALEPLSTFETKMAIHNKANEQILKQKLSNFTDKIRKLQKKVQETTWMMNSQISKSNQEQRKIIEEMNLLQKDMARLRTELEASDENRKQTMQSQALSLDNMVQQMLSQAKKLQIRVQSLRKGYEDQNEKVKRQIYNQKMTI